MADNRIKSVITDFVSYRTCYLTFPGLTYRPVSRLDAQIISLHSGVDNKSSIILPVLNTKQKLSCFGYKMNLRALYFGFYDTQPWGSFHDQVNFMKPMEITPSMYK